MTHEPKKITSEELAELHSLPDDALVTATEAAAFLRLKDGTLAWYRCKGGGPAYVRIGGKSVRYRMGDVREYAKGQRLSEGRQRAAAAMLAATSVRRACQ
ncbi:helix-turn-helix domain-containing protein [Hoeflea sp.]|jgi:hypothetical protein|uniref:helix-turn-helix transcriptional regulator n=1 Tax=Hoeflea sp. TaxID=1940281 RepID=UPI0019996C1B|nr:helix-turn-helix domain-containing protein [Hoeflea sp.]MBC7285798.1 helix-turn-helix domain-containing protein [Hoeflea sp.]MBU0564447.1 helix-turn-helix domain-containing protein [Gammaproteobacteria bacterium]MBU1806004.1 helix-turn-helix domain-containing protein [Gammaproteobacteria bacterium]